MAYSSSCSDSKVSNDSKSCMETVKLLKSQNDQLLRDLEKSSLMVLVPPPYTRNFMPPTPDLSFTGLDEFVNKPVVENRKSDKEVSKVVRKSDDSPIIEDWVSDSEEENGNPQMDLQDQGVMEGTPKEGKSQENVPLKLNSVLFNDTECIVLSPNFKLIDESQVLLRVPRKNNMYSVDLKNIVPKGGLTCLFAKATSDESKLWHRRLGHLNFKTMNKLVKGNLVRGLPSKLFENDQTCVACQKGKQHRASCKSKTENSISLPLHLLHMDLFGPTFVKSLMKKMYCLVVTDDYSRFTWVFFLATKDETSGILKSFITGIENLVDHKVKVIRCDNGTEFKNREMNQFGEMNNLTVDPPYSQDPKSSHDARSKPLNDDGKKVDEDPRKDSEYYSIFDFSRNDEDDGADADMNNLDTTI
ncbi:putative ribonuclease H-like domain-containing protein [Tanacetum coccineum]